jgi:hypothetical protein
MADEVQLPEPPPEKQIYADDFLASSDVQLASLTLAAFLRIHQAPRTREEWIAAVARFTTERL